MTQNPATIILVVTPQHIVAATNLPELLDAALFRRFDDVIRYSLPDEGVAKGVMQNELGLFKTGGVDWDAIVDEASGLSHAELSLCAQDAAKRATLSERSEVTHEDLAGSVADGGGRRPSWWIRPTRRKDGGAGTIQRRWPGRVVLRRRAFRVVASACGRASAHAFGGDSCRLGGRTPRSVAVCPQRPGGAESQVTLTFTLALADMVRQRQARTGQDG